MSNSQTALASALTSALIQDSLRVTSHAEKISAADSSDKMGWVQLCRPSPNDRGIRVRGLLVEGLDLNDELRARTLVISRNAPDWFLNDVRAALEREDYETEFRVWVCNRHPTGATAFVLPAAQKAKTALAEWDRRRAFLGGKPKRVQECSNAVELMEYFYRRKCEIADNGWYLHSFNADTAEAVAITPRGNILKLTGAKNFIRAQQAAVKAANTLREPESSDLFPVTDTTLDAIVGIFGKQERLYRL